VSLRRSDYERLLATYCQREGAIALLREHRPYLEKIPSLRRPEQSIITIPLPIVRVRPRPQEQFNRSTPEAIALPCDLALLMCDPEWQIKLGAEILVFIHRPEEDFSDLLRRWRQCQIQLHQDYEWLMPPQEQHMFSEGAEELCPLFILFEQTPLRIHKGLAGACLPYIVESGSKEEMGQTIELISEG